MSKGLKFPLVFSSQNWGTLIASSENDILGCGTYGTVLRVTSEKDPTIKKAVKILNVETLEDFEGMPATTLREVNAIKTINCINTLKSEEVMFANKLPTSFAMVMELCKGTLQNKIQSIANQHLGNSAQWSFKHANSSTQPLPDSYMKAAKVVAYQLLNGIVSCHGAGVMHRDIKPANILWSQDDVIKIADFGLARFTRAAVVMTDQEPSQTGEIQTLHYRAPEVLLGDSTYGYCVDDWSVGLCIAELFHLKHDEERGRLVPQGLFCSGCEVNILMIIFDFMGTPKSDYLSKLKFWSNDFPNFKTGRLREILPLVDDDGFDLISSLLVVDPVKRASCKELLNHRWFNDVKQERLLDKFMKVNVHQGRQEMLFGMEAARPLGKYREDENFPPIGSMNSSSMKMYENSSRGQRQPVYKGEVGNIRDRSPDRNRFRNNYTPRQPAQLNARVPGRQPPGRQPPHRATHRAVNPTGKTLKDYLPN